MGHVNPEPGMMSGAGAERNVAAPFDREPPNRLVYRLEEALDLLAALEDSRDVLIETDYLAVLSQVEHQIQILSRRLGLDQGGSDVD
jgi:hypothetical protein